MTITPPVQSVNLCTQVVHLSHMIKLCKGTFAMPSKFISKLIILMCSSLRIQEAPRISEETLPAEGRMAIIYYSVLFPSWVLLF